MCKSKNKRRKVGADYFRDYRELLDFCISLKGMIHKDISYCEDYVVSVFNRSHCVVQGANGGVKVGTVGYDHKGEVQFELASLSQRGLLYGNSNFSCLDRNGKVIEVNCFKLWRNSPKRNTCVVAPFESLQDAFERYMNDNEESNNEKK